MMVATKRACLRCHRTRVTIHARGLCSLCYLHHRDEYPRTKFHRPFTAAERDIIRREWGKTPSAAIAARLGRQLSDVYSAAVRFGAARPRHVLKTDPALRRRLVRLHGKGLSDREIGAVVGFGHGTVARWLRRLGLASNCRTRPSEAFPERWRQKIRAAMLDRIRSDGVETAIPFLRKHAEGRARAERMGWPGRTLFEARILDSLETPATVAELAMRLHARPNWTGNVVRDLRRRGFVSIVRREGRYCVYALAPGVRRATRGRLREDGRVPSLKPRGEGIPARVCSMRSVGQAV
jgi:hypothetical protein